MDTESSSLPNQANKASFDPGWNDPPPLSYNVQTQPSKPRNRLNKRVAFPLAGTIPNINTLPVNLPPVSSTTSLPFSNPTESLHSTLQPEIIPHNVHDKLESESTMKEVCDIFSEILGEGSELVPKGTVIQKKISVMTDMWSTGKLNEDVQRRMRDLAYALKEERPEAADEIHRALMVEQVGAVGAWMPGIKQLVHHCIARRDLLAIDADS